ncbi:hypothetical protein AB0880_16640 [Micromonospora chersina]|uniref:sacsin N-terminal ATP-binding-like domain-containing protein n=1 Tax=Micromonospora chersina TaxID=47854 RepID=UPI00345233F4
MASDYERIRLDNIREYGEGTRHLDFLQRLYADRTHFILELLQNAEDAGASKLTFSLYWDRLLVEHDGRPFNEQDVRGICGVDASTKSGELTSIGKFGIGFKSVYAYTLAPAVHSGSEHFRIRHYVRPEAADRPSDLPDGVTRFEFPFDRDDVPSERASAEIRAGLEKFDPVALLFLQHIQHVVVNLGEEPVSFSRLQHTASLPNVELIVRDHKRVRAHQYWDVFRRPLDSIGHAGQRVELGFRRASAAPEAPLEPIPHAPLVVYFPTDKISGLGFLLQAPLRTTPARDNIPADDPDNAHIIEQAALLLTEALEELRDAGRLGLDVFEALPIRPVDFPDRSLLRPLFDALVHAVRTRPLLPVAGPAGHASATRMRLGRTTTLRELLTPEQLGTLEGEVEPLHWQPARMTRDRNRDLWDYLRDVLGVGERDADWLVGHLTHAFLEEADDAWLVNLYRFLRPLPALWRRPRQPWQRPAPARTLPLIRLNNGRQVAPFDSADRPQAYLPGPVPSSFPTVQEKIAADPDARSFLEEFGLSEPDAVDEVLQYVMPKYQARSTVIDDEEHQGDLDRIFHALQAATKQRKDKLIEVLHTTPFLLCRRPGEDHFSYRAPSIAYWPEEELEHYFLPSPHGWFVHERYRRYERELYLLGVVRTVRMVSTPPNSQGHVILRSSWGAHSRGLHGFDPNLQFAGLESAVTHPDSRRSAYVWNRLLLPHANRLRGTVESAGRQDYSNSKSAEMMSKALELAASHAWLPAETGNFVQPSKLSLDDLPQDYAANQALADALGMVSSAIVQISREHNVPVATFRYLLSNPAAVAMLDRMRQRQEQEQEETTAEGSFATDDFSAALETRFERPAEVSEPIPDRDALAGRVGAPAIRRQRTRDSILDDLAGEPAPNDRFRDVGRRVWDGKNPTVRHFLLEQYAGRCQICTATFPKRDGAPYFEVIYLVSHTAAAWVDRPGNTLCLCPTCASKFLHGEVHADDLLPQIQQWSTAAEGGTDSCLRIELCGQPVNIVYTEKHLLELQEMTHAEDSMRRA